MRRFAQTGPLGIPRPPTQAAPPDGFTGWLLSKQAEYYRAMSGSIRAAKTDSTRALCLFGLAFAYGIFHAAGPGHGKAVISSYLVANDETWRRGVILSFASAFLQALVAVLIVGIAAVLLGATRKMMDSAVWYIEVVSYSLIALLGARLLWVKGRAFIAAWKGVRSACTIMATRMIIHMRMPVHTRITITRTIIIMITAIITVIRTAAMRMFTTSIAAIRTDRSRQNSRVPADGNAA